MNKTFILIGEPSFDWITLQIRRKRKLLYMANEDPKDYEWAIINEIIFESSEKDFLAKEYYLNKDYGVYCKKTPEKIEIQFKGRYFLTNQAIPKIKSLVKHYREKKIEYDQTRVDIKVQYKNKRLVPYKKLPLTSFSKKTDEIPIRINVNNPDKNKGYKLFNTQFQLKFYDKTQQILAKKLEALYPDEYKNEKDPIYRMELKLEKELKIDLERPEKEICIKLLNEFYEKHKPERKNKIMMELFFYKETKGGDTDEKSNSTSE